MEDVGIHAQAHQLLDWSIEAADLDIERPRLPFRRIGKVNLRIGTIDEPLQLPALLLTDGSGKERARGDSLFLPR